MTWRRAAVVVATGVLAADRTQAAPLVPGAKKIAADMAANGGIITYADLAQYRAMERAPVRGRYRGHAIFSPSPPVSTGIQLVESLQVLGHYTSKTGARAATDATYWHQVIEASKVRDPLRRVAEPERRPVDFAEHLQLDHAARLFRRIDPAKASTYERQGDDGPFTPPATRIGRGTTAFAVGCVHSALIAAQFRSRGIRAGPRAS